MDGNARQLKATVFGALLGLIGCIAQVHAMGPTVDYKFQIIDGARTTLVGIAVPQNLDGDFPSPTAAAGVNLKGVTEAQLAAGILLMHRQAGIFRHLPFNRVVGDVGISIRVRRIAEVKDIEDLYRIRGARLSETFVKFQQAEALRPGVIKHSASEQILDSAIVNRGDRQYAFYRTGVAGDTQTNSESYSTVLHDGCYLEFQFVFIANDVKFFSADTSVSPWIPSEARMMIDHAMSSISFTETGQ